MSEKHFCKPQFLHLNFTKTCLKGKHKIVTFAIMTKFNKKLTCSQKGFLSWDFGCILGFVC